MSQIYVLHKKANIKPRFEAWIIFALSGEPIEKTNWFEIFIQLEI